jgi:hypothetical protein
MTPLTKKINQLRKKGNYDDAKMLLPKERVFALSDEIEGRIGIK